MFGKGFPLFRLFGFEVRIDASWFIIAILITWTLAAGFFPYYYPDLTTLTYWLMGLVGALGLFASIVFHEFSHSLVARRFGLPIKSITLFIFGGVSNMTEEPPNASSEFFMAIAGPGSSIVLGILFLSLYGLGTGANWPVSVLAILNYLMTINFILAAFNLVPAFPLDGGRVLRSVLWGIKKNLRWATHVASQLGSVFGFVLIFFGVLFFIRGAFIAGLWWFLIGLFLHNASQMSYQSLLRKQALEGEPVRHFMKTDPVTVPSDISVADLVEQYLYRYHYKMFPVVDDGKLAGYVSTTEVKTLPKADWPDYSVRTITKPHSSDNTLMPDDDAVRAFSVMKRTGNSRLMVIDRNEKLVGIISLKDLLNFLSLKLDLEEEDRE